MHRASQTLQRLARSSAQRAVAASPSSSSSVATPFIAGSAARSPRARTLATVTSQVPLGTNTRIPIEVQDAGIEIVAPAEEMLGFQVSEGQSGTPPRENVGRPIYLDAQATTPVDPRVLDSMLPYLTNMTGNMHSGQSTTRKSRHISPSSLTREPLFAAWPCAATHAWGWEAEKAVEVARKVGLRWLVFVRTEDVDLTDRLQHIADLIGADPKDIVFTSGATESNNMAIKGIARFYKGKKRHMCVKIFVWRRKERS